MRTPDDLDNNQATSPEPEDQQAPHVEETDAGETSGGPAIVTRPRWSQRVNLNGLTSRLHRVRLLAADPAVSESTTEKIPATVPASSASSPTLPPLTGMRGRRWLLRRRSRRDRLQDWQNWSKFRLWRNTRPFWGSILMIIAGLTMLAGASVFLPISFLIQSLWSAILVSSLLLVMGVIQLFLPSYAVITGSIGMVLSIVSLLVASFGGCGIGMLFGVIGSALSIAWRPVKRSRLIAAGGASNP